MSNNDVVAIQQYVAEHIIGLSQEGEPSVLEGLAYVWQKNHKWSDEKTACVIAMLLGNVSPTFEKPLREETLRTPPF